MSETRALLPAVTSQNPLIFGDPADHRRLVAEFFTSDRVAAGFEGWRGLTDNDIARLIDAAHHTTHGGAA